LTGAVMNNRASLSVLFVCMGNICRSPSAEGVARKLLTDRGLAKRIRFDSAGTHAYHVGEAPDERAIAAARQRGIDISGIKARKVSTDDFHRCDYILAMDADNLHQLQILQPPDSRAELALMLRYSDIDPDGVVPDPYYGGGSGFERVLDLLEEARTGLLDHLLAQLN